MLADTNVHPVLGVKDLHAAKRFYEETMELKVVKDAPHCVLYKAGNTHIFVYETEAGGTNHATAASWEVKDVEKAVAWLSKKGVIFEHYDLPGVKINGDIHEFGQMKAVWFKDPSGNILSAGNAQ